MCGHLEKQKVRAEQFKDIYQDKSKVPSTSKTEKHVIKAKTFKTKTMTFFIKARQWENYDLFY